MKTLIRSLFFCLFVSIAFTGCQKEIANISNLTPPSVNAGPFQIIQLPASSFILTGSATTTNGRITGFLWSLVNGPNVPVIVSPGSPSTAVNNIVAGYYRFQLMAIDEAGLTGVDTVSILVNPSVVQTLTFQPNNNAYDVHLGLWGNINYTNNNSTELTGGAWTSGGIPLTTRGIYKFDMSAIPANATIISAKLTLYSNPTPLNGNLVDANFGSANALYIERITNNWNPANVTWQTQPASDQASQISIPHTNLSFLDLVDIDVRNQVAVMSSTSNYGFMIRLQNEVIYNNRDFCSSRHALIAKHPKLVITYQ